MQTTNLILQILVTLVSQPEGAGEFFALEDNSSLVEVASTHQLALDVFKFAWINQAADPENCVRVRQSVNDIVPKLLLVFQDTDAVTLLDFLAETLPNITSAVSRKVVQLLLSNAYRYSLSHQNLSGFSNSCRFYADW